MTVKHKGNQEYEGLSTDTKPLATDTAVNATFAETDTGKQFYNSGSAWVGYQPSSYGGRTKVYKIGSTYYAEKHDGSLISASGTLETVLQAALNNASPLGAGLVHIEQIGNFDFSASFAGISIPSYTTLWMSEQTILRPPAGYGAHVIAIGGSSAILQAKVVGGQINKATPSKDWVGIVFTSALNTQYVLWSGVFGTRINQPYTGVRFITSGTGAIADCVCRDVIINQPLLGFEFAGNQSGTLHAGYPDVSNCVFDRCSVQNEVALHDLLYGFFNVGHKWLKFIQCNTWDLPVQPTTQRTMTINVAAEDISIEGGIINRAGGYFVDNSATYRGNYVASNEWDVPRYGQISMLDSLFVRNGRRTGRYNATSSLGSEGLLGGWMTAATGEGAVGAVITYANGTAGINRPTGTTLGNNAGNHYTLGITCRGWNPVYKIKFRLNTTSLVRLFFGLTGAISSLTGDDPLNTIPGVMLCLRSADTNYQIASNDGTGVTVFTNTGVAKSTAITTFELVANDTATNKWKWSINYGAWTDLTTTDIPSQTSALTIQQEIETNESGVAKNFDIFGVYVETN
jgi:hypothetical protein